MNTTHFDNIAPHMLYFCYTQYFLLNLIEKYFPKIPDVLLGTNILLLLQSIAKIFKTALGLVTS